MSSVFAPEFEGSLQFERLPGDFAARVEDRVAAGLLCRGFRSRNNYRVTEADENRVSFEAADALTAFNVGLNNVEVWRSARNEVSFRVRYGRWMGFAFGLSLCVVGPIAGLYALIPELFEAEFAKQPLWGYAKAVFWGMLAFWGLVWPWLLALFHKKHARRCLERILREELEDNKLADNGETARQTD